MEIDAKTKVMRWLSERLSATFSDLRSVLGLPDAELAATLEELEKEGLIYPSPDPVKGEKIYSPTGRGLFKVRQQSSRAL